MDFHACWISGDKVTYGHTVTKKFAHWTAIDGRPQRWT